MYIQFRRYMEKLGDIILRHKDFLVRKIYDGLFIDLFRQ